MILSAEGREQRKERKGKYKEIIRVSEKRLVRKRGKDEKATIEERERDPPPKADIPRLISSGSLPISLMGVFPSKKMPPRTMARMATP